MLILASLLYFTLIGELTGIVSNSKFTVAFFSQLSREIKLTKSKNNFGRNIERKLETR